MTGSMLRLDPPMWVEVVDGHTPKGLGLAHVLFDYGFETNLTWLVVMNDGHHAGEAWCVENPNLRFCRNMTVGRPAHQQPVTSTTNGPPPAPRLQGHDQSQG